MHNLSNHSYRVFVHIDREKHSLRVLTLRETTKDKLENMLVSKSQAIG